MPIASVLSTAKLSPPHSAQERLVSLDAFRGLTMALMVLVNNAGFGPVYHQFQHAEWHGWSIADTIFPSFIWIVGVAITLALGKRLSAGVSRSKLMLQACRRAAVIYLFGIIVYVAPRFDLSTQRLLGVLQRIAICYLIAVAIFLTTGVRGQIVWIVGLLVAYWMVMMLVPAPGYSAGDLTVEGNLSHYVDRVVLGAHNYHSTKTWDPEGVLGTLPSIATAIFGLLAGRILKLKSSIAERCAWLFTIGAFLLFVALVCDIWLPINKHLWTSSFTLFMAGLDFTVFAGFLWLVDGCGYQRYVKPLVIFGMNAIAVYMISELLAEALYFMHLSSGEPILRWIYANFFASYSALSTAAMLFAIAYTLLMYLFAYALYRKKWFLRI